MKIGLVAPITLTIPPAKYGGTELVVSLLTEGLVAAGHDVTLFASGDSHTTAKLVPTWPISLLHESSGRNDLVRRFIYTNSVIAGRVAEMADQFDLIHSHIDENALVLSKITKTPLISTIHSPLDQEFQRRTYQYYDQVHYVALSQRQRSGMPDIHWCDVIYNGIDISQYQFNPDPDDYLLFIGRISPEKNPASAIDIARRTNQRLVIAAKIDPHDRGYFEQEIAPLLKAYKKAEFVGEVESGSPAKAELFRQAKALLFPIDWEEPFGLVMIEALAAGTPVLATGRGAVPEIVEHGVSGFVGGQSELVAAVAQLDSLDRAACRRRAEDFSAERMVQNYLQVYQRVLAGEC